MNPAAPPRDIEADAKLAKDVAELLRKADNLLHPRLIRSNPWYHQGEPPEEPTEVQAFRAFRQSLDAAKSALLPVLGHPDALKLIDLDRERWTEIDGETRISYTPFDQQSVAYDLATWMFDRVGRFESWHGPREEWMTAAELDAWKTEVSEYEGRMRQHISEETADLAMKFWQQERHDT